MRLWTSCAVLLLSGASALANGDGLEPPVLVKQGVAQDWKSLATQVQAGELELAPREEGRLLNRAMRSLRGGDAEADLFVSAVIGKRLAPYRRPDGTIDWESAQVELPPGLHGEEHLGLPLFLEEAARVVKTGDPSRIDELAERFSRSDLLRQTGVLGMGIGVYAIVNGLVDRRLLSVAGSKRAILRGTLLTSLGLSLWTVTRHSDDAIRAQDPTRDLLLPLMMTAHAHGVVKLALRYMASESYGRVGVSAARRLLSRSLTLHRGAKIAVFAGEVILTALIAEELIELTSGHEGAAAMSEAGEAIVEAALAYRRGELDRQTLEAALTDYQQAWAIYRNVLYQPLARADGVFVRELNELEREAQRRRTAREQVLATYGSRPALLKARLRAQKLNVETVEGYRQHMERADAQALLEAWESAATTYSRAREVCLEGIYRENLREAPFLPAPQGALDADAKALRKAHGNLSHNRLQTYEDEAAAIAFLFEHVLAGREPEIAAVAQSHTARQRELDGVLFGAAWPSAPQAEGGLVEGLKPR